MDGNREYGFYWIYLDDRWIVAEWEDGDWHVPGREISVEPDLKMAALSEVT